ncbi:MAG: AAA family ATPase [Lysobacteraceae bacterium]|nr:MAG: AAA family ATPase [Xanthomonadaceae bacterium]
MTEAKAARKKDWRDEKRAHSPTPISEYFRRSAINDSGLQFEFDDARLNAEAAYARGDYEDGRAWYTECDRIAAEVGYPYDPPLAVTEAPGYVEPKPSDAAKPTGIVFTRVGDRLASGLKPIAWLVRGYVESDSLALLFGDPNCGKSFVAIDLACCIATGREWHGRKTKQGAVFYIAGEGQNGLDRRFAAWSQGNDAPLTDAPIYTSSRPAMLRNEKGAAEVANAVQELVDQTGEIPALIVVDTLARNFGGDENSTEDMGAFVTNLDVFLRKSGEWSAAVLVVHHCGKADKTQGRGNSALRGAIDAEYSLAVDEDKTITMQATKMKDAGFPEPVAFRMRVVEIDGELDEEGEPVTSVVLEGAEHVPPVKGGRVARGRNQTLALSVLRELTEEVRRRALADGRPEAAVRVDRGDWRDRLAAKGINKQRFYELQNALKNAGLIVIESGGWVSLADESPL